MKETIKKEQFSILSSFLMISMLWGFNVYSIFHVAKQDSWISIILSMIFSFIPIFVYYLLLNHNSKLNIVDLINHYFKGVGKIINFVLILFILLLASMCLWNLTNFISSQYLYQTPRLVIACLFMLTSGYIVSKGLHTIGRCGTILFIINVVLFALSAIALTGKLKIDEIFPILEFGFIPVFKGSYLTITFNVFPLFTLLIIPKDNIENNKKLVSSFMKTYFVTFITIFIVIFFTTTCLGARLAVLYQYPEFHILKLINIVNFFQRVESILSIQIIFSLIMSIVLYIYYLKTAFIQNFKIKKKDNIIIIIFSILIIILSRILFENTTVIENFSVSTYPIIAGIFLFIIPFIILCFSKIKKD